MVSAVTKGNIKDPDFQRHKLKLTARESLVRDFLLSMMPNGGDSAEKLRKARELADEVLEIKEKVQGERRIFRNA